MKNLQLVKCFLTDKRKLFQKQENIFVIYRQIANPQLQ